MQKFDNEDIERMEEEVKKLTPEDKKSLDNIIQSYQSGLLVPLDENGIVVETEAHKNAEERDLEMKEILEGVDKEVLSDTKGIGHSSEINMNSEFPEDFKSFAKHEYTLPDGIQSPDPENFKSLQDDTTLNEYLLQFSRKDLEKELIKMSNQFKKQGFKIEPNQIIVEHPYDIIRRTTQFKKKQEQKESEQDCINNNRKVGESTEDTLRRLGMLKETSDDTHYTQFKKENEEKIKQESIGESNYLKDQLRNDLTIQLSPLILSMWIKERGVYGFKNTPHKETVEIASIVTLLVNKIANREQVFKSV